MQFLYFGAAHKSLFLQRSFTLPQRRICWTLNGIIIKLHNPHISLTCFCLPFCVLSRSFPMQPWTVAECIFPYRFFFSPVCSSRIPIMLFFVLCEAQLRFLVLLFSCELHVNAPILVSSFFKSKLIRNFYEFFAQDFELALKSLCWHRQNELLVCALVQSLFLISHLMIIEKFWKIHWGFF